MTTVSCCNVEGEREKTASTPLKLSRLLLPHMQVVRGIGSSLLGPRRYATLNYNADGEYRQLRLTLSSERSAAVHVWPRPGRCGWGTCSQSTQDDGDSRWCSSGHHDSHRQTHLNPRFIVPNRMSLRQCPPRSRPVDDSTPDCLRSHSVPKLQACWG